MQSENFSTAERKDIEYPREFFWDMINQDSRYAFYLFQWINYNTEARKARLKTNHDIKLFNGEVHEDMYPNANSWHGPTGRFNDDDVEFIRLSKRLPWSSKTWQDSGQGEDDE